MCLLVRMFFCSAHSVPFSANMMAYLHVGRARWEFIKRCFKVNMVLVFTSVPVFHELGVSDCEGLSLCISEHHINMPSDRPIVTAASDGASHLNAIAGCAVCDFFRISSSAVCG